LVERVFIPLPTETGADPEIHRSGDEFRDWPPSTL